MTVEYEKLIDKKVNITATVDFEKLKEVWWEEVRDSYKYQQISTNVRFIMWS